MIDAVNNDLLQNLGISSRRNQEANNESSNELGMDAFLDLMIAQIRNQDPFEPIANGEFISQLAEFGTVSGIGELQNSFASFTDSSISNQALQAASLVGRSVQVPQNIANFETGGQVTGAIDLTESGSFITLQITDLQGRTVRNIDLGTQTAGLVNFSWDGTNDNGELLPAGQYQVSAQALVNNETTAFDTFINQEVESVTIGSSSQGTILNLEGGGTISLSQVREIR